MPFIEKDEVIQLLMHKADNSSHYVWTIANLKFFKTSNEWIFAFVQVKDVTLLAVDPLMSDHSIKDPNVRSEDFKIAWEDFVKGCNVKIASFVGITSAFFHVVKEHGFQSMLIGKEPWLKLKNGMPMGNSAKGIRSAKNQAIRAGVKVETYDIDQINNSPYLLSAIKSISREWEESSFIHLYGFMLATDPLANICGRKYFLAFLGDEVCSFLIATPIPGTNSYYLEDLIYKSNAPKGVGNLLTWEALKSLHQQGFNEASLGVVITTNTQAQDASNISFFRRKFIELSPKLINLFYNSTGCELYRSRFKPQKWSNIYMATTRTDKSEPGIITWLKVFVYLFVSYKPKLNIKFKSIFNVPIKLIKKYSITLTFVAISTFVFCHVNHFKIIPHDILLKYGFYPGAPHWQWIYRVVTSDFLYYNVNHFLFVIISMLLVLSWAERTHKKIFVLMFVIAAIFLDDIIKYYLLFKPFQYFQPSIYKQLMSHSIFNEGEGLIGGSLILMSFLGLQLDRFRRPKSAILFAVMSLALLLAITYTSESMLHLVYDLDHVLFLAIGFIIGKIMRSLQRKKSRMSCKLKTPSFTPLI